MNKTQSVVALAKATGLSTHEVRRVFVQVAALAEHCLRTGEELVLPGLGRLRTRERQLGPAEGDVRRAARFLIAKPLREAAGAPRTAQERLAQGLR